MKILIVDTETTGLDASAEVCELAATLCVLGKDTNELPYFGAISSISTVASFIGENNAFEINRINPNVAREAWMFSPDMIDVMVYLAHRADYIVSFVAEFDKPHWAKYVSEIPWICAQTDFDWGYKFKERFKLVDLALWLGIGVSFSHRAGDDVRLLVECFNRIDKLQERFDRAIERSRSPWVELQAFVSFQDKELAKNANFGWDKQQKKWLKKVKECDREAFVAGLNFEVGVANEPV